jgi:hypothetical protein
LKRLVEYQEQSQKPIHFRLQGVAGEDKTRISLYVMTPGQPERLIFENWDITHFAHWERAGYIRVVTGGLVAHSATFRLTERGIAAAKGA